MATQYNLVINPTIDNYNRTGIANFRSNFVNYIETNLNGTQIPVNGTNYTWSFSNNVGATTTNCQESDVHNSTLQTINNLYNTYTNLNPIPIGTQTSIFISKILTSNVNFYVLRIIFQ